MRLIPDDCCHYRYPTHLQRYCSATRATSHGSSRVFCWMRPLPPLSRAEVAELDHLSQRYLTYIKAGDWSWRGEWRDAKLADNIRDRKISPYCQHQTKTCNELVKC